jgi:hypothetical protein
MSAVEADAITRGQALACITERAAIANGAALKYYREEGRKAWHDCAAAVLAEVRRASEEELSALGLAKATGGTP